MSKTNKIQIDDTKSNNYLQELSDKWQENKEALDQALGHMHSMRNYLYALHLANPSVYNKKYLASLIGVKEQRINGIFNQVRLELKKKGGEKS